MLGRSLHPPRLAAAVAWRREENLAARPDRLHRLGCRRAPADPLCRGSGTLLIEAACAALGRCPGPGRVLALRQLGWISHGARLAAETAGRPRLSARRQPPRRKTLAPVRGIGKREICRAGAGPQQRRKAGRVAPWLDLATGRLPAISGPPAQPGLNSSAIPPRRAARAWDLEGPSIGRLGAMA